MIKKILLPTDFSEYARLTAGRVREIPGTEEIILLNILDGENTSSRAWLGGQETASPREYADRILQEEVERLRQENIPVTGTIIPAEGRDAATLILSSARKGAADLIMIGARGKGFVEGLLLGSVSSEVLRHATMNILLIRHAPSWKRVIPVGFPGQSANGFFEKVVFPVDFSKPCEEGIEFLRTLYGIRELVLLHIITKAGDRKELEDAISGTYQQLQLLRRSFDNGSTKVTILIRFGRPADMICEMAVKEKGTLIFMPRFGASDYIRSLPIGSTASDVAKRTPIPLFLFYPKIQLDVLPRELEPDEFPIAELVWTKYHQQKADPAIDRVFGVFVEGMLVCLARCRRHPGGCEVDGVFTLEEFRGRGYAKEAMEILVAACGREPLYMHSTLQLTEFYGGFGFQRISEQELPPDISARFDFAMGEMQGSNVQPMMRPADPG
jgi:nucleotide-binding universal stress UspA family protein